MAVATTILVIEDDSAVAAMFVRLLALGGYTVLLASDGEAGLHQLTAHHADAALVDFRLPTFNGLEFVHRLRNSECGRCTPVAIVTADYALDDATLAELNGLGVMVYFKPLWVEDVLRIAERLTTLSSESSERRGGAL